MASAPPPSSCRLRPERPIQFVSKSGAEQLSAELVSVDAVGLKAFGLASIPAAWTLPFITVAAELMDSYRRAKHGRKKLVSAWARRIAAAAKDAGIGSTDRIIVRSSACSEGISRRGKFYSTLGEMASLDAALAECLEKLATDQEIAVDRIPLIIQKRVEPARAKGHLSNERRCYEENRDWMGEFESTDSGASPHFQINLRHWRRKTQEDVTQPLICAISPRISEALKTAADWAYRKGARIHFEWVWDGSRVLLVQADEEAEWTGHDPVREQRERAYHPVALNPQCVRLVGPSDARRFSKIGNAFIYMQLQLPTAPLYVLDDQEVIAELATGSIPTPLANDLATLVKGSLVIRTDLETTDLQKKQLLPRTQELHDAATAGAWMIEQSHWLAKSERPGAFILHNFIPALSSAFAYATPREPLVQIEGLWGLPEGLYYNSHDKYVVDTVVADVTTLPAASVAKFSVRERRNYKRFFVSTTPGGNWETLEVRPPFDWRGSLSKQQCREIAYQSRRIATAQGEPVSIMWFVGVSPNITRSGSIPWYHEPFDIAASRPSIATRTKTPFDRCFVIRTEKDLAELRALTVADAALARIRVQPFDEKLLRDKNTLKNVGDLAKAKGATIVLEGAVLSHAYYQLLSTGAIVEVVHPFIGFDERHGFNKLVRDRIPDIVRERGEHVTTAALDEEALVRALREKLVEEAFEVLDAKDLSSVVSELADVREVVDTLIARLKVSPHQMDEAQTSKRNTRGGFAEGTVLVETQTVLPSSRHLKVEEPQLIPVQAQIANILDEKELRKRSEVIEKRTDSRIAAGRKEIKVSAQVPVSRTTPWTVVTSTEPITEVGGKLIHGRARGSRVGSHWLVEVSVFIEEAQPELL